MSPYLGQLNWVVKMQKEGIVHRDPLMREPLMH